MKYGTTKKVATTPTSKPGLAAQSRKSARPLQGRRKRRLRPHPPVPARGIAPASGESSIYVLQGNTHEGGRRQGGPVIRKFAWTLLVCVAIAVPVGGAAAGGGTTLDSPKPTWWGKLQRVSAPGFEPTGPGSGSSIQVGPNIDVSNEIGPQSETSIAIKPSDTSIVVAGSNEIDRLPMRGYF